MKVRYVILGLVLIALAIKLYPPLTYDFPVNFDSIYHARIGQAVADTGWVPSWDYAAGGRPHLYPPLYHLLLGYGSLLFGIPVIVLVKFILPIVSVLLILPVFFLIREYRDVDTAILGATFAALNPIIVAQAYDSPQLFGLLLFPLIVYYFLKGHYPMGGGLLAVSLLFNYFIAITIGAVLFVFALLKLLGGEKKFAIRAGLVCAIGVGLASPWLLVSLTRAGECFNPSTAVASITGAGMHYLLMMAPFVAVIGFLQLNSLRKRNDDYTLLWKVALGLGTVGFLVSLVFPQLHPYDQLLLFGFSIIFIVPELKWRKERYIGLIMVILVCSIYVMIPVKPALSSDDLAAVYWLRDNVHNGTILANPEVSGAINTLAMSKGIRTEFDLFLECVPDATRWSEAYEALSTSDIAKARSILERHGVNYVVVGARDIWNYGFDTDKFKEMGLQTAFISGESKVYTLT